MNTETKITLSLQRKYIQEKQVGCTALSELASVLEHSNPASEMLGTAMQMTVIY